MTVSCDFFTSDFLMQSLAEYGFSISCLSRFIAFKINLAQAKEDEPENERQYSLDIEIRRRIYDMMLADKVESQILYAISDLSSEIDDVVDSQVNLFNESSIKAFRTVTFESEEDYDSFATPYNSIYSMKAFNVLQKRVENEMSLRNIYTQMISFDAVSYLDFLKSEGKSLAQLQRTTDSMIFAWGCNV